jgi:hypothetical protein
VFDSEAANGNELPDTTLQRTGLGAPPLNASTLGVNAMNHEFEQRILTELRPDEKLLWTGQPAGGIRLRGSDAVLIPFSLLWGGFAVFWEWQVLQQGAPGFFALWGIPFVLVGIYIVIGRFFVDAALRTRTYYGLTDQRAIIISGLLTRELRCVWLRNLAEVSLREGPGSRGTIELGSSPWPMSHWFRGTSWPGMSRYQPPGFELIEQPRHVYNMLQAAQTRSDTR